MVRRTALFLLWMLLLLTLPGCGGLAGFAAEPVTIRFAYLENAADYAPLVEEFQRQNRNITVELVPIPWQGDPGDTLRSSLETADAVRFPGTWVSEAFLGGLMPLESLLTTEKDFPLEDYSLGAMQAFKTDGKQLAIPASITPYVMFYNPEKFSARGVTPPMAGWTLEDFLAAAIAVHNADESLRGTPEYTFGFCSNPEFPDPVMIAYLFGGGLVDNINNIGRPTLNIPANVEALNWYASLRNDFGLLPEGNPRTVGELIVRGNCGMWMDFLDRSTFGAWMQDNRPLGVAPFPSYATTFGVAVLDGYGISATSENSDAAWKWLRFLVDQPAAAGKLVPPRGSHRTNDAYTAIAPADVVALGRSLPNEMVFLGIDLYRDPRLGMVLEAYNQAAEQVLSGEMDAQSALDAAQAAAESGF